MKRLVALLALTITAGLWGCGADPLPTCGPTDDSFRICDGGSVYECPAHDSGEVEMSLIADCEGGGQTCVEVYTPSHTATCE